MVDKALSEVAKEIAIRPHYDNWIGGKWVAPVRGQHAAHPAALSAAGPAPHG
jgi:aldehyde dehydrogenase